MPSNNHSAIDEDDLVNADEDNQPDPTLPDVKPCNFQIVDDEPDVHEITSLSPRGVKFRGWPER